MKSSNPESVFYIQSDEDEDVEKGSDKEGDDDGNDSEYSDASSVESHMQNRPGSYNTSWPQSYRQSIDIYSTIASPSIGFMGTPSLSRLGGSFLSSSLTLTRRHTPEVLPTLVKPLLPTDEKHQEQQQQQDQSSYGLLPPPIPTRKSSAKKILSPDQKPSGVSHELPLSQKCSYGQAVLNGVNVLCGVGILSTSYAAKEGGWMGLSILFIYAVLAWYTGVLLRYCLDSQPGLETYPDIGQAAFGTAGRMAVSIILYVELYAACVEYITLESDNLSVLFPNAYLSIGGFVLDSHHLFALMATAAVLPTLLLRDLRILSYISAGGVLASILVVLCLFWVGLVDQVGFQNDGTLLKLSTLPVAIGLYGFCYSGHAVFPNIYTSMANPSQYPSVLLTTFGVCTLMYAGVAFMGYTMFGESTQSQFTLNLPHDLVASKIAVWTTVVNPFTKYALTMTPVAMCLEELIPSNHRKSQMYGILIRTALVISTLLVGLTIPFFGLVLSLIGSLFTMLVTLILPCACFLSILKGKVTRLQVVLCILIIIVGVVSSVFGTFSALSSIIEELRS